jgi:Glutamine synthetase adenylyltransferase
MDARTLEEKLDDMRRRKTARTREIREAFDSGRVDLVRTMVQLTDLADGFLVECTALAKAELRPSYGIPEYKDSGGQFRPSEIALIGMGKLGGRELHFGSDLDLLFVFSRHGHTTGGKTITNQEYFAKLAQRVIGYMGLYTRYGYLYKVDTELRPSGNAGTLVTDLHSWTAYYHELAALWERQALLKARVVFASGDFSRDFKGLFRRLIFLKPFPENMAAEIHRLRMRMEKELAKESARRWNYKKGYGGVVDIEFAVQYLQLKLGKIFEQLLSPNTLEALHAIGRREILKALEVEAMEKAYLFYRRLEIILEIRFNLKDGYLDLDFERMDEVASALGFSGADDLIEALGAHREKVRRIYLRVLQLEG